MTQTLQQQIFDKDSDFNEGEEEPRVLDERDEEMEVLRKSIEDLNQEVRPGDPRGIRSLLESKNEFDPGHEHVFLPRNKTTIYSAFESLDGWSTGGVGTEAITQRVGGVQITTGSSTNDDAFVIADTSGLNSFIPSSKASIFQTVLSLVSLTNVTAYWGVGDITAGGGFGGGEEGYGFKFVNGTLSALSVEAGNETLTTISGITLTDANEYKAIFNATADGQHSVTYLVNGLNVATHRANLPDTDDNIFGSYYIKTTTTSVKTMYLRYFYFVQQI